MGIDFIRELLGMRYLVMSQLVLAFALLPMMLIVFHIAPKFSLSRWKLMFAAIISAYVSYIFARLFSLFFDGNTAYLNVWLTYDTAHKLKTIFNPLRGGNMFFGALAGTLIGMFPAYFLFGRRRTPFLRSLDAAVIAFIYVNIYARFGDFIDGTGHGFICESFGMIYPPESSAARDLVRRGIIASGEFTPPLFPASVLGIIGNLTMFLVLYILSLRQNIKVPLYYVALFLTMYGPFRFVMDFIRDDRAAYIGPLTVSQWLCILSFFSGLFYFFMIYPSWSKKIRHNNVSEKLS